MLVSEGLSKRVHFPISPPLPAAALLKAGSEWAFIARHFL